MKFVLPFLLVLAFVSPASAGEVTGSAYWYHNSTTQYAAPNHNNLLAGEFSLAYTGAAKLAPVGALSTTLKRVSDTKFSVEGIFYHVGVQYKLTPEITLEAKHGSWHNLDSSGRTELYNKVGMQIKL